MALSWGRCLDGGRVVLLDVIAELPHMKLTKAELVTRGETKFRQHLTCPDGCRCQQCFQKALDALVSKSQDYLQGASNDRSTDPTWNNDRNILSSYTGTDEA